MGIKTREEYKESLRKQSPKVYMEGEEVKNLVDHPGFQVAINNTGVSYELEHDPKYRDFATLTSPLINEEISRWTNIQQNEHDALAMVRLMRGMGDYFCPCCYRCLTSIALNSSWAISYDIDQKYHTDYHQRVVEFVKEAQRNDWIIGAASIDPKGDRSLKPSEQQDPDLHLHVIEKKKDGIIVRGAKAHVSCGPYAHMLSVRGSSKAEESEKDYAVGFFTPVDAEGLIHISKPAPAPREPKDFENPISSKHGGLVESMIIFDDVFVPWERVFLCGEYEFGPSQSAMRGALHAMHKCMCQSALADIEIGATALIADYNGLLEAPNIQESIGEMIMGAEIMHSCAIASALEGWKHESGAYIPKAGPACTGKVFSARNLGHNRFFMQDVAGGFVATMASEKDYKNPKTKGILEKYYKGREGVPTEFRIRAFKLIEDLVASPYSGWRQAMAISGGGDARHHKHMAMADYDLEQSIRNAKIAAGIKGD